MLEALRKTVCKLNQDLPRYGLVTWTSGNVSGRDPESGLVVIKPSGVPFEELTPENMVIVDVHGKIVEGALKPSSDVHAHNYVYRHRPDVMGVVHTHSNYATAFAALGRPIPVYLTAMADEFGGPRPRDRALDRRFASYFAQEPRRIHGWQDADGCRQGRRDDRGRRAHGVARPAARSAGRDPGRRGRPRPTALRNRVRAGSRGITREEKGNEADQNSRSSRSSSSTRPSS